ncbi:MAG: hypothetical protein QNL88_14135 [Acidobacteriota bacterium]|nr:hypothetical protein [Acidobacteriota bacterium]
MRKRASLFRSSLLLGILVLGGSAMSASAQTCNVPGNRSSIQIAVNDASCSTIAIGPGTFAEIVSINRSLTMVGSGIGLTTITGQVMVNGFGVDVLISDLSVDTTGPGSAGCFDDAMRVVAGANARAINVRAINATGSGPCLIPLFADGFETGNTIRWSSSVGAT